MTVHGIEQNLGCDIVGGAANGFLPFSGLLDEGGETEVSHLDVHVAVQEDVAEFEVAVDDLVGVHIMTSTDELYHEETGFGFSKSSSTAEHVHEGAVVTELEGHVDVVGVFETFLETNDVGVVEGLVNLDFCVKLGNSGVHDALGRREAEDLLLFWLS